MLYFVCFDEKQTQDTTLSLPTEGGGWGARKSTRGIGDGKWSLDDLRDVKRPLSVDRPGAAGRDGGRGEYIYIYIYVRTHTHIHM